MNLRGSYRAGRVILTSGASTAERVSGSRKSDPTRGEPAPDRGRAERSVEDHARRLRSFRAERLDHDGESRPPSRLFCLSRSLLPPSRMSVQVARLGCRVGSAGADMSKHWKAPYTHAAAETLAIHGFSSFVRN